MVNNRLMQLKFIANIFKYSLEEIKNTLGFEALTMIFRRVGESVGEKVVERFKGKYSTIDEFCDLMIKNVIEPVVGENSVEWSVDGNKVQFTLNTCPYKKAGFPIKDMSFFCDYTEGLFHTSLSDAFPEKDFNLTVNGELISKPGCDKCKFTFEW